MKKISTISITRFGPWANCKVDDTIESTNVSQTPQLITNVVSKGSNRVTFKTYLNDTVFESTNGSRIKGDPVVLRLTHPTVDGITIRPDVSFRLKDRVLSETAPGENAATERGKTWRALAAGIRASVLGFVTTPDSVDPAKVLPVDYIYEMGEDGVTPVKQLLDGKEVRVHPSLFESADYVAKLEQMGVKVRTAALEPNPSISPVRDGGSYWWGDVVMKWITPPVAYAQDTVEAVFVQEGGVYRAYGSDHAKAAQTAYEAARDAHNSLLEEALIKTSKGVALTTAENTALARRPAAADHPVVLEESDLWWNKAARLSEEIAKVTTVTGITDENLRTKLPRGAAGLTIDELDALVKKKRQEGDVRTVAEIIADLAAPENQKTNQPWWDRVLDTVDGFGAGTKEVLKDWGPAGTVGAYGGVKAVNAAESSPWIWAAIAAGVILLLTR